MVLRISYPITIIVINVFIDTKSSLTNQKVRYNFTTISMNDRLLYNHLQLRAKQTLSSDIITTY